MKKGIRAWTALALGGWLVLAVSLAAPAYGASLTLDKEQIVIQKVGDTATVTATVTSGDSLNVVWSGGGNVASVASTGSTATTNTATLTGQHIGVATVTATVYGVSDTCRVIVQGSIDDDDEETAPQDFRGARVDSETIRWTWLDLSNDEEGFIIYDDDGEEAGRVEANVTEWEETGLEPDTSYTRYVRAFKEDEETDPSNMDSERTEAGDDDDDDLYASEVSRNDVLEGLEEAFETDPEKPAVKFVEHSDTEDEEDYRVVLGKNTAVVFPNGSLGSFDGDEVEFQYDNLRIFVDEDELHANSRSKARVLWFRVLSDIQFLDSRYVLSPVFEVHLAEVDRAGNGDKEDGPATLELSNLPWTTATPIDLWRYDPNERKWQKFKSDLYNRGSYVKVTAEDMGRFVFARQGFDPAGVTTGTSTPIPGNPAYTPDGPWGFPGAYPANGAATPSKFTDLRGHWAAADVEFMAQAGLVSGRTSSAFAPDATITRAEFVALISRVAGFGGDSGPGGSPFSDVSYGQWYYPEIMGAYQAGIVTGDGRWFRPNSPISREEGAALLARAARLRNMRPTRTVNPTEFADWGRVSQWGKNDVALAVQLGFLNGRPNGALDPQGTLTRAEGAVMVKAFYLQR